ncbi:MAG: four helix bundle protein [Roseimicrobium sp.]
MEPGAKGGFKSYRELIVWQKSMQLVTDIYRATESLPKAEQFGLTAQIRRAAVSVPCNIAEGFGRQLAGDFTRFLTMARGSLYELQTQIEIALNLRYLDQATVTQLSTQALEIERMLNRLISTVRAPKAGS